VDSVKLALSVLANAARTPTFWLLFATFFVCGFTTNGLVGTHLISFCGDRGLMLVQAGGLLALMGLFDMVGTTASGWLTDRYDPRKLLFMYYSYLQAFVLAGFLGLAAAGGALWIRRGEGEGAQAAA
jgi:cyanate permease